MNEYTIIKIDFKKYDRLILCLTFESLLSYISKVEESLAKNLEVRHILIDQLLLTGNNYNRFIEIDYSKGKFDFNTVQIVEPSNYFRKKSIEWLHNNYGYVINSILTDEQRQKIKDNVMF